MSVCVYLVMMSCLCLGPTPTAYPGFILSLAPHWSLTATQRREEVDSQAFFQVSCLEWPFSTTLLVHLCICLIASLSTPTPAFCPLLILFSNPYLMQTERILLHTPKGE